MPCHVAPALELIGVPKKSFRNAFYVSDQAATWGGGGGGTQLADA